MTTGMKDSGPSEDGMSATDGSVESDSEQHQHPMRINPLVNWMPVRLRMQTRPPVRRWIRASTQAYQRIQMLTLTYQTAASSRRNLD